MSCVHPVKAWRNTFSDFKLRKRAAPFFRKPPVAALNDGTVRASPLPCGKCITCRLDYSRQWAMRGVCELQSVDRAAFVTLTYDSKHLPSDGSLVKADYQKFLKRLRRAGYNFTYMLCGEYGERLGRPHYHAIIFGESFRSPEHDVDEVGGKPLWSVAPVEQSQDMPLYYNEELNDIWGKGFVVFGDVTFASIQYVAGYVTKKVNGERAKEHYNGKLPEFMRMSLKTPIGSRWFDKFHRDVYPRDEFVFDGNALRPPKYFQKRYAKKFPDLALDLAVKREKVAESRAHLNTPEILAAKKEITLARFRQHVRRLEKLK